MNFDEGVHKMLSLDAHTTVRELLATYPQTFDVLVRHGMCADCKADPPPVPLSHFADKHCHGNLAGLLEELAVAATGTLSSSGG